MAPSRRLAAALLLSLFTLGRTAASQEGACTIQGKGTLEDVVVSPAGAPPFTVTLTNHPFTVIPSPVLARRSRVVVGAPLSFMGQVHKHEFTVAKTIRVADGMIRLQGGAVLPNARGGQGEAIGILASYDNAKIHGVAVPCESLTLDEDLTLALASTPLDTEEPKATDTAWRPRERALLLRERPGAGRALWLTTPTPAQAVVSEIETRGGWRRVRFDGNRWSVTGWASRYDLQEIGDLFGSSVGDSFMSRGGCRMGFPGGAAFAGLAPIRAGAPVFAEPGKGPWAAVTALELEVLYYSGERWVKVTRAPGITEECALNHAFLRVEDVMLPENVR